MRNAAICTDRVALLDDQPLPDRVDQLILADHGSGLSLHHLPFDRKLEVMHQLRRLVGPSGTLLVYENTCKMWESRAGWMRRWERQHKDFSALSSLEWLLLATHVHSMDHPETASSWRKLGHRAGFRQVHQHYRCPSNLFRLFSFTA